MFEFHRDQIKPSSPFIYIPHPRFPSVHTYECLPKSETDFHVVLPRLRCTIHTIDFLFQLQENRPVLPPRPLRFQQDTYRLWYQLEGGGILQNVTRKTFGTARPGLLGVMERGERHTYLHQKGPFSCFQMQFSLFPSYQTKCYWNAGIEGKTVLEKDERLDFERHLTALPNIYSGNSELLGLAVLSRLIEIILFLFNKGLILIEESRFPKNKSKSLVMKAKNFMNIHYASMHHQRELEQECGIDINYLNILFRKETGCTLYQYVTGIRIEHAKHLLETSSASISDIASDVGYPNANSFSRAFKRREKRSPVEYRTQNRSSETAGAT